MARKKPRKTAFVPRLLVPAAAAVSVVPAVAATVSACSSDIQNTSYIGVAAVAYPAYEAGPDDASGDAKDAGPDYFGVAAVAYPAYEAGTG